jgi:hypothetical protein
MPDNVTHQGESAWIQYMHCKKIIRQWKHKLKLKMPRFLWQGKIKRLLARHEFHLSRAISGQALSYTSACFVY